jgi:iron(III) transport system permease protein
VSTWANSGTQLTAAMALIQTAVVMMALIILFQVTRDTKREM